MRLLAVELTRYRSRRAIALLALASLAAAALLALSAAWDTRPLSADDRREAASQAELESQRPALRREVRACAQTPDLYLGPGSTAADCTDALVPPAESYYPREALDLGDVLRGRGLQLAMVVVGLLVVAGSTFAGADRGSGSLATQLLFEPRRGRVWWAKAGAVTLGGGLVALVALGGFWTAMTLLAEARGIPVAGDLGAVGWQVARGVALACAASLGAYALTMLLGHTVATLALLFVYSVGGEIAINLLPLEGASRWSLGTNVLGWLAVRHRYLDATIVCDPGERCSKLQVLTHLEAGAFLGVLLLVATVLSLLWFRRRDV